MANVEEGPELQCNLPKMKGDPGFGTRDSGGTTCLTLLI